MSFALSVYVQFVIKLILFFIVEHKSVSQILDQCILLNSLFNLSPKFILCNNL